MRHNVITLCCGVACVLAVTICAFLLPTEDKAPSGEQANQRRVRLVVEDVGNVPPGSRTNRDITIENDSAFPWIVSDVRSACGCVVDRIEPERIQPVQTRHSPWRTSARWRGSDKPKGLRRVSREKAPIFICHLTGFVEPWCYAVPKGVDFGSVAVEEGQDLPTRTVVLRIRAGSRVNWRQSPKFPEWLDVKMVSGPDEKNRQLWQWQRHSHEPASGATSWTGMDNHPAHSGPLRVPPMRSRQNRDTYQTHRAATEELSS